MNTTITCDDEEDGHVVSASFSSNTSAVEITVINHFNKSMSICVDGNLFKAFCAAFSKGASQFRSQSKNYIGTVTKKVTS